jgi:hypothetical protein
MLTAGLKAGTPLKDIIGSGFSAELSGRLGYTIDNKKVESLKAAYSKSNSATRKATDGLQQTWTKSGGVDFNNQVGVAMADEAGVGFKKSVTSTDEHTKAVKVANALKNTAAAKIEIPSNIVGANLNSQSNSIGVDQIKQSFIQSGGTEDEFNAAMTKKLASNKSTANDYGSRTGLALEVLGEAGNDKSNNEYLKYLSQGLATGVNTHDLTEPERKHADLLKANADKAKVAAEEAAAVALQRANDAKKLEPLKQTVNKQTVDQAARNAAVQVEKPVISFSNPVDPVTRFLDDGSSAGLFNPAIVAGKAVGMTGSVVGGAIVAAGSSAVMGPVAGSAFGAAVAGAGIHATKAALGNPEMSDGVNLINLGNSGNTQISSAEITPSDKQNTPPSRNQYVQFLPDPNRNDNMAIFGSSVGLAVSYKKVEVPKPTPTEPQKDSGTPSLKPSSLPSEQDVKPVDGLNVSMPKFKKDDGFSL